MISFIVCLVVLIAGYFVYGAIVDRVFGPDDRETPEIRINDGVDFVAMPRWKLFLILYLMIDDSLYNFFDFDIFALR